MNMPDEPFQIWKSDSFTVKLFACTTPPENRINSCAASAHFLYNQPAHIRTQTNQTVYSFYLFRSDSIYPLLFLHFSEEAGGGVISPPAAPFGGIEPLEELSAERIHFLLSCVNDWARARRFSSLIMKLPALVYHPSVRKLLDLLCLNGYQIQSSLDNHHIEISETPFEALITSAEKRRLKKCKIAGFKTNRVANNQLWEMYQFIAASRTDSGYPMSTSFSTLQSLSSAFPSRFLMFNVCDDAKIIAAAILLRVSPTICYTFLPATDQNYYRYSPMVLLTETLYNYCFQNAIRILDLGTSCDERGTPKPGLIRFKSNLGGIVSRKHTVVQRFD